MKFLVVIDQSSALAQAYGKLLSTVRCGEEKLPVLECTEMDLSNPLYMFVRTSPSETAPSGQSLHLPHGIVHWVIQYAESERPPAGFF